MKISLLLEQVNPKMRAARMIIPTTAQGFFTSCKQSFCRKKHMDSPGANWQPGGKQMNGKAGEHFAIDGVIMALVAPAPPCGHKTKPLGVSHKKGKIIDKQTRRII